MSLRIVRTKECSCLWTDSGNYTHFFRKALSQSVRRWNEFDANVMSALFLFAQWRNVNYFLWEYGDEILMILEIKVTKDGIDKHVLV